VQSLRVVDILESNDRRRGMNLTQEVRDGIVNHTGTQKPFTLEGQIVKISDRIAYINHDIDDAMRSAVIFEKDLPTNCVRVLGDSTKKRIDTLVRDMIRSSDGKDAISQSPECAEAMNDLRSFMFQNVYFNKRVKRDEELEKIGNLIFSLYDYYLNHPDAFPQEAIDDFGIEEVVKDRIASMTDRYAVDVYCRLFVPTGWQGR
jgi:dGTPase